MGKLIVVENDKVEGKDTHNIAGGGTTTSAPPSGCPYKGTATFDYAGKMTGALSDFVKIDNKPVAVKTSTSSLNAGEDAPSGKHGVLQASNPTPPNTSPCNVPPIALSITDPIGTGKPNSGAGSTFVKIDSVAILLDGDKIDTCDGLSKPANSTVTAEQQDFVSCSA